jgi:hypothetical protein
MAASLAAPDPDVQISRFLYLHYGTERDVPIFGVRATFVTAAKVHDKVVNAPRRC